MKTDHSGRSFLLEMIFVVFFFSICAAICIQVFVKADTISKNASDLNHAVVKTESIADTIRNRGADFTGPVSWDKNWDPASDEKTAVFTASIVTGMDENNMLTADIRILKNNRDVVYELTTRHYLKP